LFRTIGVFHYFHSKLNYQIEAKMILIVILFYASHSLPTQPQAASSQEQTTWISPGWEDWTLKFDTAGWKEVAGSKLMTGFERSGNANQGANGIYHLEKVYTAEPGTPFVQNDCTDKDWTLSLDNNNVWATCPDGKALHGLMRTDGDGISNIEQGRCCPGVTTNCYTDLSVGDEFDYNGATKCADGHALAGFYKGTCNDLHCIEKFKCCRLTKEDPNNVHVIGYWTFETYTRPLWNDVDTTITKKMTVGNSETASTSEQTAWADEVSETHSVTVAVEASGDIGLGSGSLSSQYGYEHSHTHSSSFSNQVENTATQTYQQDIEVSKTWIIPQQVAGEPTSANVWYFKTKAIKPDNAGGFLQSSHSLLDNGIMKTGCGYDLAPNCLPGKCHPSDPQCWQCTDDKWVIDPNFQPPSGCTHTGYSQQISSGSCADISCSDYTQSECVNLFGATVGLWEPNAFDGSPAPDKCYIKNGGTASYWFNTRTSTQDATMARQKLCKCAGSSPNCDWVAVSASECPSDPDIGDCHDFMSPGQLCEADSVLPNGQTYYNINNCGAYDVFKYACNGPNSEASVGSSFVDLDQSGTIRRFEAHKAGISKEVLDRTFGTRKEISIDELEQLIRESKEVKIDPIRGAQLSLDSAVGIENFGEKATNLLAVFGVGAILYGMAICVTRKTEYIQITEPEV